jgi:hypothetical protein
MTRRHLDGSEPSSMESLGTAKKEKISSLARKTSVFEKPFENVIDHSVITANENHLNKQLLARTLKG